MTAVPEALWTSRGQGLRAAIAMMYAPNPVPIMVKKPMKIRDLKTNIDDKGQTEHFLTPTTLLSKTHIYDSFI